MSKSYSYVTEPTRHQIRKLLARLGCAPDDRWEVFGVRLVAPATRETFEAFYSVDLFDPDRDTEEAPQVRLAVDDVPLFEQVWLDHGVIETRTGAAVPTVRRAAQAGFRRMPMPRSWG